MRAHASEILAWWADPKKAAPEGGCHHTLADDGSVKDPHTRHLVSSTRLVVNFCMGKVRLPHHPSAASWGERGADCLAFLHTGHKNTEVPGGWSWVVDVTSPGPKGLTFAPLDEVQYCYGLAFVLLAHSWGVRAGLPGAAEGMEAAWDALTTRFWEPSMGLYADQAEAGFTSTRPYRGQNANMHALEAHLAAFDATGQAKHLQRARVIAHAMCVRNAAAVKEATHGHELVYEHYHEDWSVDLEFNKDKPGDRFLPYGFQPGHLMEWAKLLMQLHQKKGEGGEEKEEEEAVAWRPRVAARLFRAALKGWDEKHGGLVYSLFPTADLPVCNVR